MRKVRMMIGVAAATCLFVTVSAPTLAKTPPVFKKFRATASGSVKGIGEASEMVIGPYKFEECEKELHAKGAIAAGEQETLTLEVKFAHCESLRSPGRGLEEPFFVSFTLNMEFHSNGAVKLGATTLKAGGGACVVTVPEQWVPSSAETALKEFEAVSYSTEKEKLSGGQEKKYGEFRERLEIEWELKGITAFAQITPTCKYKGSHLNNETHEAEYAGGRMEGELEEVTVKGGNLAIVHPL